MVDIEEETSNQLIEILEEWEGVLKRECPDFGNGPQ
jgi:hypothetical protein